ncbi:MAG: 30S ribosomal protein S13 [bacterium]
MMRISGITIPDVKKLEFGLTAIYGIGRSTAVKILKEAEVSLEKKASEITAEEENAIRKIIEVMKTEGTLKREISANIKRLKDVKAYRGVRHMKRLPVYGQRTKTNSRTVRGNIRKTMGSGKRKLEKT